MCTPADKNGEGVLNPDVHQAMKITRLPATGSALRNPVVTFPRKLR